MRNVTFLVLKIRTGYQYVYNDQIYNDTYIQDNGSCVPTNPAFYRWSFSFVLLFVFFLFSTIWAGGMYWMWMDNYLHSHIDHGDRRMGIYRAAADLVFAMTVEFGEYPPHNLSNAGLERRVKHGFNYGYMSYAMLADGEPWLPETRQPHIREWAKRSELWRGLKGALGRVVSGQIY